MNRNRKKIILIISFIIGGVIVKLSGPNGIFKVSWNIGWLVFGGTWGVLEMVDSYLLYKNDIKRLAVSLLGGILIILTAIYYSFAFYIK